MIQWELPSAAVLPQETQRCTRALKTTVLKSVNTLLQQHMKSQSGPPLIPDHSEAGSMARIQCT